MATSKRYRCRVCGDQLNAYLPWAKAPNSALLLGHWSQQHMDQLRPYLARLEVECIDTILTTEWYDLVEAPEA
jgi:hypothetical protein